MNKKLERELKNVPEDLHRLYLAVRKMNTFVCEVCHKEELMEHPELGTEWNREWHFAMAEYANATGWDTPDSTSERESWLFEDFMVVGPQCIDTVRSNQSH